MLDPLALRLDLRGFREEPSGFLEEYLLDPLALRLGLLGFREEQKAKEMYKEYHQGLNLLEFREAQKVYRLVLKES